jgi:hypothetical protein
LGDWLEIPCGKERGMFWMLRSGVILLGLVNEVMKSACEKKRE